MSHDDQQNSLGWIYGACALDARAEDFGPFSNLVSLWQGRCEGGAMPARRDFDFYDFEGWWGKLAIAAIEEDPFAVRFTLWGTQLTDWWGVDYTGRTLGELAQTPQLWWQVEDKYFEDMVAGPFIGLVQGDLEQYRAPHRRVIGLDLPLPDPDGPFKVLMAHLEIDPEKELLDILPSAPIIRYL